ncbi:MAG: hypothetical protein QM831_38135 [Kofleriaceae bacterium]
MGLERQVWKIFPSILIGCGSPSKTPPPTPIHNAPPDAAPTPPAAPVVKADCLPDERQWGTTCCRIEKTQRPSHDSGMHCRGPNLGKACTKKGDCDLECQCDAQYIHKDGLTGVGGTCIGGQPAGEWLCILDENGRVVSRIID